MDNKSIEVEVVEESEQGIDELEEYKPSLKTTSDQAAQQIEDINSRKEEIENRLKLLNSQFKVISEVMEDTAKRMNALTDPIMFKKRSQLQSIYMRQIEIQSQIIDAISKQESLLQTYIKMRTDTTNAYYRNYKISKELQNDDKISDSLEDLLKNMKGFLSNRTSPNNKNEKEEVDLIELAEKELAELEDED